MNFRKRLVVYGLIVLSIFFQSCKKNGDNKPGDQLFYGDAQTLGAGKIRSFAIIGSDGNPKTIGLKFTSEALSGLPTDSTIEHDTPVPISSEFSKTGFDHLEVDWNPAGHEPKAIYGRPHFDFHFYMISKAEQAAVIPGPDTVSVPANFIPQDYISGVIAVPDMGVHWFDPKAPEFSGQKFTDTFIYGFYHGHMTFIEPMITSAFILTHADFKINIKQPQDFQRNGFFPAVQHIYFDASTKEYVVALEGLIYHSGKHGN